MSLFLKLLRFPLPGDPAIGATVSDSGVLAPWSLAPGEKGFWSLPLPATWRECDALYLTATDPYGRELFTCSGPLKAPEKDKKPVGANGGSVGNPASGGNAISGSKEGNSFVVSADGVRYYFDEMTGTIEKSINAKGTISLSGGPKTGVQYVLKEFKNLFIGG